MEMRDKKNRESADWLRTFNRRSQALKRSGALHAKLPDQKDMHEERLQQHRSVLVSKAVHLTVSQPLNVTSQQPHFCHRSSNYNLLFYKGSLTNKKWENMQESYGIWRIEFVNGPFCLSRWNRWVGQQNDCFAPQVASSYRITFFFLSSEKREGSGRAGVLEQTEEKRNNRALYSTSRGREWRVLLFQIER